MRKLLLAAALSFTAFSAILFSACAGDSQETSPSASPSGAVEIPTRWASGNAASLAGLTETSDEVFIGRVTQALGQQETAAGPGSKGTLPLTSFEVTVSSTLSGTVASGTNVIIEQVGGTTTISDGDTANVILEGDRLLEVGAEYLFFADRKPNGNLTSPPFGRLQIGPDGSLTALPRWAALGAIEELSGLQAAAAESKVVAAE